MAAVVDKDVTAGAAATAAADKALTPTGSGSSAMHGASVRPVADGARPRRPRPSGLACQPDAFPGVAHCDADALAMLRWCFDTVECVPYKS